MSEACRIVIHQIAPGQYDVGAPMKYKEVCYDMLRDAAVVIERQPSHVFNPNVITLIITMSMAGVVDVSAPLPPIGKCSEMLVKAKDLIERFNDDAAPVMRAFSDKLVA